MCFSAEASFTSATLLTFVGYACITQTTSKKQLFLACFPLLFALQQFSEGVLWVCLQNGACPPLLYNLAMYGFLFFAFVLWPIWVSISFLAIESNGTRRKIIAFCLLAGIIFSTISIGFLFYPGNQIEIVMAGKSLQYDLLYDPPNYVFYALRVIYIFAVIIPPLLSSLPYAWAYGIVIALTFFLADFFYAQALTSVWCFFAAVVSACIFVVLRINWKKNHVV